ncbi:MAG: response regulator [Desulfobacterota bacterium]|nr:response regulator [Thermodesulfobacteriota bacterium]
MGSKRILVVDDDEVIRRLLRTYLTQSGYEVTEAEDGQKALERLGQERFDLLICDVMMPHKDGWEVVREVRSRPELSELPIIMLTAKGDDSDMFKGYELGANYYMTKPFTKAQLLYGLKLMFEETP